MIFCFRTIFIIGLIVTFPFKYATSHIDEPLKLVSQNETNDFVTEETKCIDFSIEKSENIDFVPEKVKNIEFRIEENEKYDSATEESKKNDTDFSNVFHGISFDSVKPYIYDHYPFNNVSENCSNHLAVYFNALEEWEPWAVMMFDATGKTPDGFLMGSFMEYGSLDDCLEVTIPHAFKPQFCTVGIEIPIVKPIQERTFTGKKHVDVYGPPPEWIRNVAELVSSRAGIYMGTCIPSSCSEQDLLTVFHSVTKPLNSQITIANCQVDEPKEWATTTKIAIVFLALWSTVIVAGTVMDLLDQRQRKETAIQNKSVHREMVKAFSIHTNAAKLFKINEDDIGAVHLVKIILCLFVIAAHINLYPLSMRELRYNRLMNFLPLFANWKVALFDHCFFVVDAFFVLGGILLAVGAWKELEETGGKLNITFIILKKYMRFTPSQIILLAMLYVGPILSSGPIWIETWRFEVEKCNKYGWKNFLHVQNFRGNEELCQIQTWYIAATVQQYFVVLPLLVLIYRHLKSGLAIAALLIIGCTVHDFIRSVQNELLFGCFSSFKLMSFANKFARYVYYLPMHHLSPTLFGMAVGVLLYKIKDTEIRKIYQIYQKRLKILAIVSFLIAEYSVYYPTKDFRIMALFNSTRTTLFSFAFSWIIYSAIMNATSAKKKTESTEGNGLKLTNEKPVPIFSSPKIDPPKPSKKNFTLATLAPFSRITYSTYLFHPLALILRDGLLQEKYYMGILNTLAELILLNTLSFGIGIFGYLVVEKPVNKAFDLWMKRDQFKESPTKNGDTVHTEKTEDKEKEL